MERVTVGDCKQKYKRSETGARIANWEKFFTLEPTQTHENIVVSLQCSDVEHIGLGDIYSNSLRNCSAGRQEQVAKIWKIIFQTARGSKVMDYLVKSQKQCSPLDI